MNNKAVSRLCVAVVAVELVAITGAWMANTINPLGPLNNPLSGEGVRWMFRNMMSAMVSEWLVALLLFAMSMGCMEGSGLTKALRIFFSTRRTQADVSLHYRERMGLRLALLISVLFVVAMALLTTLPEAMLLSATGDVFPSPFSAAVMPAVCLWLAFISIAFGIVKGEFRTVTQVCTSFFNGISRFSPFVALMLLSLHCINVIKMLIK